MEAPSAGAMRFSAGASAGWGLWRLQSGRCRCLDFEPIRSAGGSPIWQAPPLPPPPTVHDATLCTYVVGVLCLKLVRSLARRCHLSPNPRASTDRLQLAGNRGIRRLGLDWTGLDWMDGWIMDAGESGDAGSSPALELIDADDGGSHRKPESLDSVLPLCPWTGCEVCRLSE